MPIYEYSCKKCGETIEVIQKYSDSPLKKHAGCGGALTKLISQSGFQFKGTGWYVTDYGRKGQSQGEGSKSSSESKESSDSKDTKESKESKGSKDTKDSGSASGTSTDSAAKSKSSTKSTAKPQ